MNDYMDEIENIWNVIDINSNLTVNKQKLYKFLGEYKIVQNPDAVKT